jgi:hypothetical protein
LQDDEYAEKRNIKRQHKSRADDNNNKTGMEKKKKIERIQGAQTHYTWADHQSDKDPNTSRVVLQIINLT